MGSNSVEKNIRLIEKTVAAKKKKAKKVSWDRLKDIAYVDEVPRGSYTCYHIRPKNSGAVRKAIFYLYDSMYCYPIKPEELKFITELMKNLNAEIFIPLYPLLPEAGCSETFDMLVPTYSELMSSYDPESIVLMGSGSGAGLALSLALMVWKEGLGNPGKTVLLSPCMDTEFFDEVMTEEMIRKSGLKNGHLMFDAIKEYINREWVRNMAGMTEFTSPIYQEFTELTGDIIVASGSEEFFNVEARAFSKKLLDTGHRPFFFEYKDMRHGFYLDPKLKATGHLKRVLHDLILDKRDAIIDEYMYEVKERGEWSKKFPEIFQDDIAVKYLVNHKINYEKYRKNSEYRYLVGAATQHDMDEAVSLFLKEYPDCTVVYLGCRMDTMFDRVDNGRVTWYNLDSPGKLAIRNLYKENGLREHNIEKSVSDTSWFDDVHCEMDKGLLFVCRDTFETYTQEDVAELFEKLYDRFRGCSIILNANNHMAVVMNNLFGHKKSTDYRKQRFYMNDPNQDVELWNPAFITVSVKSVLDGIVPSVRWKGMLKFMFRMSQRTQSSKVVRVRLGYERFRTF